eukprot:4488100-Pleurochrysis_carterae.AAC.1
MAIFAVFSISLSKPLNPFSMRRTLRLAAPLRKRVKQFACAVGYSCPTPLAALAERRALRSPSFGLPRRSRLPLPVASRIRSCSAGATSPRARVLSHRRP